MAENRRIRFGIFFKLTLVMILVAAVPLGVVWYISHAASEAAISQDVGNRLSSTADQLRGYVESWIDMNARVLRQNAELPDMISMDGMRQKKALESIVASYEWVYLAFTVDINGQNISRSDSKDLKDYSDRRYVRQVLGGQPMGQQVLISKTTGKPALVISVPIKDEQQHIKGVLAIGMSLADISAKIATTRFGDTGFAILLDQDGRVISHINEKYTTERTQLLDHPGYNALMVNNSQSLVYTNEAGKKVFSQMRKTSHGWILLVQQDYDEAFAALKTYNQQTQLLMLVSLILVILVSFLVARQLTRPIRQLTLAADAISRGNFDFQITDTARGDELGDLARAVERLGSSVRLAMERFNR
ncbi:MAG: cache and HAMP domain-containing protein [Candidatus Thiodiazotropha sp.]|jgi:methyl-accepting chemotaxis protein